MGGKIVAKPEDLIHESGVVSLVVAESCNTENFAIYEGMLSLIVMFVFNRIVCLLFVDLLQNLKVITVDLEWLTRSIGQYKLGSLVPYTLCSENSLDSLNYPEELLLDETIEESDVF